jgi:hypothetical protein
MRIISSANIPPQREDWGVERQRTVDGVLSSKLPVELQDMVRESLPNTFMTIDKAKEYRLELMEERGAYSQRHNREFESGEFSLCEH